MTRSRAPNGLSADERLHFTGWVITDSGCWEWSGFKNQGGYGIVRFRGVLTPVHRLAYETWVGPIPEGYVVRHKCDNPPCINPEHLETGTQADNVRDRHYRNRIQTKLSQEDVQDIKILLSRGLLHHEIAQAFGVSRSNISLISSGAVWSWITIGEENGNLPNR